MKTSVTTQFMILLLVLLPVALMPLLGAWVLAISALLLLLLLVQIGPAWGQRLVLLAGALGGLIGVVNAGTALLTVGGTEPYSARAGFGWAALVLAVVAAGGGLLALRRPRAGAALMLLSGLAGAVAINLFFINTFYVLALACWLPGAVLALRQSGDRPRRGSTAAE